MISVGPVCAGTAWRMGQGKLTIISDDEEGIYSGTMENGRIMGKGTYSQIGETYDSTRRGTFRGMHKGRPRSHGRMINELKYIDGTIIRSEMDTWK